VGGDEMSNDDEEEFNDDEEEFLTSEEYQIKEIEVNIEQQIRKILEAGAGANEPSSVRPLREVMQNADDARADRLVICINEEFLQFINDGECLTRQMINGVVHGSQRRINQINTDLSAFDNKMDDPTVSGNFGTGLRSTHLFSDTIEIHAMLNDLDKDKIAGYIGRAQYNRPELFEPKGVPAEVMVTRSIEQRPAHVKPLSEMVNFTKHGCIHFKLRWRTESDITDMRRQFWGSRTWPLEKITQLSDVYEKWASQILLGCRHLREVVISTDIPNKNRTIGYSRDFDLDGGFYPAGNSDSQHQLGGKVDSYTSNSSFAWKDIINAKISNLLTLETSEEYILFLCRDQSGYADYAKKSNLEPHYGILAPTNPSTSDDLLPVYTPIALAASEEKRNHFAPIGYMPPHESRRYVLYSEDMNLDKKRWSNHLMASIGKIILPALFEWTVDQVSSGNMSVLQATLLLPRQAPDIWFCEGEKGIGAHNINTEWKKYCSMVVNASFFPVKSGRVPLNQTYRIGIEDEKVKGTLYSLFEKLNLPLIDDEIYQVLKNLSDNSWGEFHPSNVIHTISSPADIKPLLDNFHSKLTVKLLGKKLINELMDLFLIKRPSPWEIHKALCESIPCIPDNTGQLRPYYDEEIDSTSFFGNYSRLSLLIPDKRIIHEDYREKTASLSFLEPSANILAKLVDEAAAEKPDEFNDLEKHPELHKQISQALVDIVNKDGFELSTIADFNCVPCKQHSKIFVRKTNRVNDLVWGVTHHFPNTDASHPWQSHAHRDFIFSNSEEKRKDLNLGEEVYSKITWLELHPEVIDEGEIGVIQNKLMIHEASTNQTFGIGLIRSMIFAESGGGIGRANPVSLFKVHDNDEWEIDRWLGKELTIAQRNVELDGLLSLLKDKEKLSGGWGATKSQLTSLKLFRDDKQIWRDVDELALELPEELAGFFDRKKISNEHKNMLMTSILVSDMPTSGGSSGGFGIPLRMDENVILTKLNSLEEYSADVSQNILTMMLKSEEPWEINELAEEHWVPCMDGEFRRFDECILPTQEFAEYFGKKHPYFVKSDANSKDPVVIARAKELGILTDHNDVTTLLTCLLNPTELWPGFSGKLILDVLASKFKSDPSSSHRIRRNRLPTGKKWIDNGILLSDEHARMMNRIYPEKSILAYSALGDEDVAEMVKSWIIPSQEQLELATVVEDFRRVCEKASEDDYNRITAFFEYFKTMDELDWKNIIIPRNALFPRDNNLIPISKLIVYGEDTQQLIPEGENSFFISEEDNFADLLTDVFGATSIERGITEDSLKQEAMLVQEQGFNQDGIKRLWLLIATSRARKRALTLEVWPCKTATGFELTSAAPIVQRMKALVPMEEDSNERLNRIIQQKIPVLWLPREQGPLQQKLYDLLRSDQNVPFFTKNSKPRPAKGQNLSPTPWPALTNALSNIMSAVSVFDSRFQDIEIQVQKTNERITQDLDIYLISSNPVFWKESTESNSVMVARNENTCVMTISVASGTLNDGMIIKALRENLGIRISQLSSLVTIEEEDWPIEVDSKLEGHEYSNHLRPLITEGVYSEYRERLQRWYGKCQYCGRSTPANRLGDFLESVVSLFKERGGRYYSDSIPYSIGNVMYLCPNHKALYARSNGNDLMWIPDIDKAKQEILKSQDRSQVAQICQEILGKDGELTLGVSTYERVSGQSEPTVHTTNVTWNAEHAAGLRNVLTQYFSSLIRR
jgi:hypothetical protein